MESTKLSEQKIAKDRAENGHPFAHGKFGMTGKR